MPIRTFVGCSTGELGYTLHTAPFDAVCCQVCYRYNLHLPPTVRTVCAHYGSGTLNRLGAALALTPGGTLCYGSLRFARYIAGSLDDTFTFARWVLLLNVRVLQHGHLCCNVISTPRSASSPYSATILLPRPFPPVFNWCLPSGLAGL